MSEQIHPSTLAAYLRNMAARLNFRDVATAASQAHVHARVILHADLLADANEVETYLNTARENIRSGTPSTPVRRQDGAWSITFARGRCVTLVTVTLDGMATIEAAMPGGPPPISEHIDQLLARAESMLTELQSASGSAAAALALQFGYDISAIGRALTQRSEFASAVDAFVARTAPIIDRDTGLSIWFGRVYDAADSRSSETEVYMHALGMRSDLEFFLDLYRDSVAHDRIAGIDLGDTDENLKEWGAQQYLEEIPLGFPASHVWWHQSLSGK